ncbi:Ubiquitin-specific peptidase 8 (C19 family) [Fasciolopsis buskii]|uniref:ubiquitinyl hydrolase 1 n=1 Tax=Fasciolopsis buskii TaxID=27845 RepID=A0A8E0VG23_9TREM|nr:Ubiquitin-specific peptidase 8 (C19 family) [Fasciolopsis buski]
MVAKDREFREAQRKHKREEEEAARKKKAAAAAAVATAAAAAAVSRSPHIATHSEEPPKKGFRSPETGEQKCASLSNDLNSVSTDKHTPVPSDSCSASVDLEERLRVLRVCKPKPANPAIPKSSEVVDPILLQPPQVSALPVVDCPVQPNQHAPETIIPRCGSAQAHLDSIRVSPVVSNRKPTSRTSVESSVAGFSGLVKPSEIFPSCHERPLGLRNLGNTCYMNAVIQSLSHTRALVTFFLRCLHKELTNFSNPLGYGGAVSAQFQRLFTAVWSAADCTPELTQFKNVVSKHCSTFAGSDQQDSLEFLLFLLDGLHEDMNEARKGTSAVTQSGEQADEDNENLEPRQRAALAWERHLGANKSVIVSSFQVC